MNRAFQEDNSLKDKSWSIYPFHLPMQPPDVFYKKMCSQKILQYSQKKRLADVFSGYCEIFENIYFEKYLGTAVSASQGVLFSDLNG